MNEQPKNSRVGLIAALGAGLLFVLGQEMFNQGKVKPINTPPAPDALNSRVPIEGKKYTVIHNGKTIVLTCGVFSTNKECFEK